MVGCRDGRCLPIKNAIDIAISGSRYLISDHWLDLRWATGHRAQHIFGWSCILRRHVDAAWVLNRKKQSDFVDLMSLTARNGRRVVGLLRKQSAVPIRTGRRLGFISISKQDLFLHDSDLFNMESLTSLWDYEIPQELSSSQRKVKSCVWKPTFKLL